MGAVCLERVSRLHVVPDGRQGADPGIHAHGMGPPVRALLTDEDARPERANSRRPTPNFQGSRRKRSMPGWGLGVGDWELNEMPTDQNQQGRRPYYHRGRRGPDRRGPDRRNVPAPETASRENVDVEQIMREIRSRIAQRHGIELTSQQIQELAARRLEAILDPRTIKPSLLEQLRRSAATPGEVTPAVSTPAYVFDEPAVFESHSGLLRFIRRILNPLLRLFINPDPMILALAAQTNLNAEIAALETDRERRQAEWNALH